MASTGSLNSDMLECIPYMAEWVPFINTFAALTVIVVMPNPNDREKIALLLGIDVDEFYPPEIPSLTGNTTTEDGIATIGEVKYKTFTYWCISYAVASIPASLMLATAVYKKSSGSTIPWFICKIVVVVVQVVGFIYYITNASLLKRVIITVFLNFVYTVGTMIIVYKAAMKWPEGHLHVIVNRIPDIPRLQDMFNKRSNTSNQNVGQNTADSQTDNSSGNVDGVSAEVNEAVASEVNEAEELGEGVSTELDKAEGCTVSAVKEAVSEESEMKSSVSEVPAFQHVELEKVEVPASDQTEEMKEVEQNVINIDIKGFQPV
ncbi:uncharacterized protein [Periplaneta americana]|uniref:uncharacterized protein n=1 Tax=Periplaneta americana TaxID=6978 RepID=UPI0037E84E18